MSIPDHRPQTGRAYDAVAVDYARLLPDLDAETRLDVAMIDDFGDRCAQEALGPVLDAGCGTGRVSAHLAARGLHVIGIDLSPGMVATAAQTHPGLDFRIGQLEDLPLAAATLGGLLAWYSLIHTAPDGLPGIAAQFTRVLTPGAWLLTAFQSGEGERVDRTSAYGRSVTLTSYRHHPEQVSDVLASAGLEVHVRVQRAPEGTETTPQCILLARA